MPNIMSIKGAAGGGLQYVNRGDATDYDFTEASLTWDYGTHELDLSSIVPVGAVLVFIGLYMQSTATTEELIFFPQTHSLTNNVAGIFITLVNMNHRASIQVALPGGAAARKINYQGTMEGTKTLFGVVQGWLI